MAYLPQGIAQSPDDEEEKRQSQQSPTLGGGGGLLGSGPAAPTQGASTASPKQAPGMGENQRSAMQPSGSGFVNLQSYMSGGVLNNQRNQVAGLGQQLGGSVRGAFDKDRTETMTNIDSQTPVTIDQNDLTSRDEGKIKRGLAGYSGPAGMGFNADDSKDFQRFGKLGDIKTGFDALHPELKGENGLLRPGYGQGGNWLDQAIFQGDAGTQDAVGNAKAGFDDLKSYMGTESGKVTDRAAEQKKLVDSAVEQNRATIGDYAGGIISRAQQSADAANTRYSQMLNQMANPEWVKQQGITGITGGGQATAGNFIDKPTSDWLGKLSEFMGNPKYQLQSTGPYQQANFTQSMSGPVEQQGPPESLLDYSDTYQRDPTSGAWVNKSTGETYGAEWQYNPQSNTWKNVLTGESKSAGRVFNKTEGDVKSMLGSDANGNRYIQGWGSSQEYSPAGNIYEAGVRRKKRGK